ncbi:MAG: hypothetical protein L0Z62_01055 [Gemmataceae bacterium]|nr:hypothetical protein [Gemmataceae bacterium]
MADRPKIPVPGKELTPRQLAAHIEEWATEQGYQFELSVHSSEFGKVTVRDPVGGATTTIIPNAHHGRRLRKDQVRYVVQRLNANWKE